MPESQLGYLYILISQKSSKFYFGSTVDLVDRLERHNPGRVVSTRSKGPWSYVAVVRFDTIKLARKAEQWLKRMHRKELLELIINKEFTWPSEFGEVHYGELG